MTAKSLKYLTDIAIAIDYYDSIDNSIVWAILKRHLEPLRLEILILLKN
jgi:uncharacterized protein with HEPN domain